MVDVKVSDVMVIEKAELNLAMNTQSIIEVKLKTTVLQSHGIMMATEVSHNMI